MLRLSVSILLLITIGIEAKAQKPKDLPKIEYMLQSIDNFYYKSADLEIQKIRTFRKYKALSYLPSFGYSPFVGGFSVSLNLASPLQEIRKNYQENAAISSIQKQYILMATDLKNSVIADYNTIQNLQTHYNNQLAYDSLQAVHLRLYREKYRRNEITPNEYISFEKANEAYTTTRKKQLLDINTAIQQIRYKAKMDVTAQ